MPLHSQHDRQQGYALLVILLVLCVFVITLAKAMPGWTTAVQRERENRDIDHAREYRMAIKRYFHKNGRYPASIDVLIQKDGSGIRYLREEWPDLLSTSTASDSSSASDASSPSGWEIIHYGQAVKAEIVDQPPAAAGGASNIAGPNLTVGSGASASGAAPGGSVTSTAGVGSSTAGVSSTGIIGMGGTQAGGDSTGLGAVTSGVGASTTGPGANLGGGPVIGVAPLSKKPAIHSFNGFDIPNDWQFVYNFAQDTSLTAPSTGSSLSGTSSPTSPTAPAGFSPTAPSPTPAPAAPTTSSPDF